MPIKIGKIKLYTFEELGDMLGVPFRTLKQYYHCGRIKAIKLGGKTLVSDEALSEFLECEFYKPKSV